MLPAADVHGVKASLLLSAGVTSSTIVGVTISASKTRANRIPNQYKERADRDGHWGIEFGESPPGWLGLAHIRLHGREACAEKVRPGI